MENGRINLFIGDNKTPDRLNEETPSAIRPSLSTLYWVTTRHLCSLRVDHSSLSMTLIDRTELVTSNPDQSRAISQSAHSRIHSAHGFRDVYTAYCMSTCTPMLKRFEPIRGESAIWSQKRTARSDTFLSGVRESKAR